MTLGCFSGTVSAFEGEVSDCACVCSVVKGTVCTGIPLCFAVSHKVTKLLTF